jgi:8-oxo-dGTP diphosphatase
LTRQRGRAAIVQDRQTPALRDRFPIVVHVLLRRDDSVLLVRRSNTGYMDGWWAAPGGHVDAGEDPSKAALRECREEVGVAIAAPDLIPLAAMPYRSGAHQGVDFIFSARRWHGEPRIAEPERFDALAWHRVDALPTNVVPYLSLALELARQGKWFHEFISD